MQLIRFGVLQLMEDEVTCTTETSARPQSKDIDTIQEETEPDH